MADATDAPQEGLPLPREGAFARNGEAPEARVLPYRLDIRGGFTRTDLFACLSLASLMLGAYLLNAFVFPDVAAIYPLGREISTVCGALASLAVAVVAFHMPRLLHEGAWSGACLALFAASLAMLLAGIACGSPALVAAGSPFGGIGQVWFSVLVGVAFARVGLERSMVLVPSGFVIAYLAQAVIEMLGARPGCALAICLYFLCTVASYLAIRTPVREQLSVIRKSQAPMVLDATNPHSFLPFGSMVFVSVCLFNGACGYAFAIGMAVMDAALSLASFAPVVALFFLVAVARRPVRFDTVYQVAALLVVGGLLLVPLRQVAPAGPEGQAAAMLLQSGADCFSLLTYVLIASIGARNPIGSLSVSASTCAAGHLGIAFGALTAQGVDALGADLGAASALPLLGIAAMTFLFVLFNLVVMKSFSFDRLIQGMRPVPPDLAQGRFSAGQTGGFDDRDGATVRGDRGYATDPQEASGFATEPQATSGSTSVDPRAALAPQGRYDSAKTRRGTQATVSEATADPNPPLLAAIRDARDARIASGSPATSASPAASPPFAFHPDFPEPPRRAMPHRRRALPAHPARARRTGAARSRAHEPHHPGKARRVPEHRAHPRPPHLHEAGRPLSAGAHQPGRRRRLTFRRPTPARPDTL